MIKTCSDVYAIYVDPIAEEWHMTNSQYADNILGTPTISVNDANIGLFLFPLVSKDETFELSTSTETMKFFGESLNYDANYQTYYIGSQSNPTATDFIGLVKLSGLNELITLAQNSSYLYTNSNFDKVKTEVVNKWIITPGYNHIIEDCTYWDNVTISKLPVYGLVWNESIASFINHKMGENPYMTYSGLNFIMIDHKKVNPQVVVL